jgi:hypothetical protein
MAKDRHDRELLVPAPSICSGATKPESGRRTVRQVHVRERIVSAWKRNFSPAQLQPVPENGKRNVQPTAVKGGKLTLDQAVLDAVGEKGNGKTISGLLSLVQATAGKTHKLTPATVGLACYRLKKKGQIKNVGRGMYALV